MYIVVHPDTNISNKGCTITDDIEDARNAIRLGKKVLRLTNLIEIKDISVTYEEITSESMGCDKA